MGISGTLVAIRAAVQVLKLKTFALKALNRGLGYLQINTIQHPLRRALALASVCWLPLVLGSLAQNTWNNPELDLDFMHDYGTHIRFLVALPLLILTAPALLEEFRQTKTYLMTSGIIREEDRNRIERQLEGLVSRRTRGPLTFIVVLLALAISKYQKLGPALPHSSWLDYSLSAYWYSVISLPIYLTLGFNWIYALYLWCIFLFRLSFYELNVFSGHPDGCGGFNFVSLVQMRYSGAILAIASVNFSNIGILLDLKHVELDAVYPQIIGFVVLIFTLFVLTPPLILLPRLFRMKSQGTTELDVFSTKLSNHFQSRWIDTLPQPTVLTSNEISSFADLRIVLESSRNMRILPLDRRPIFGFIAAIGIPFLPLLVKEVPLREILLFLLKTSF